MLRLTAVLALLAMAVSGCANTVAGSPVANEEAVKEANAPLTAKKVFGDFSTIDYCSLVNTRALPETLGTVVDNGEPNFDFCLIAVQMKGVRIEGQVGYLENRESMSDIDHTEDRQRTPPRGLKVHRGEESSAACERFLQFADDLWLTFTAVNYQENEEGDWCPFADAMVDVVIDRIGTLTVRRLPFEQSSVGTLNACDLVKPDVVAAKLGVPKTEERRYPSGHECEWRGSGTFGPRARLTFDVRSADGRDAKAETIAGRTATVIPNDAAADGELSTCLVETEHIDSKVFRTAELVDLHVGVPGKGKDACGPAREIAKEVWANLPKS